MSFNISVMCKIKKYTSVFVALDLSYFDLLGTLTFRREIRQWEVEDFYMWHACRTEEAIFNNSELYGSGLQDNLEEIFPCHW